MPNLQPAISELSESEIDRYSRQLILGTWNAEKQLYLKSLKVAVSAQFPSAILYLAAAGVGEISVCDFEGASAALVRHAQRINTDIKVTEWNGDSEIVVNCAIFPVEEPKGVVFTAPFAKVFTDETNLCLLSDRGKQVIPLGLPHVNIINLAAGTMAAMSVLRWWESTFLPSSHNL